jgi:hypothetical protein
MILERAFEYERIKSIVLNNGSDYVYGKEYIYFHSTDINYAGRSTGGISSGLSEQLVIKKKVLYLTYMGVLKALFCARGDKADRFLDWATRILFTMQMGNQEDKDKLAADALEVDVSTVKQLFRKSCRAIPCVYLFEVGTVGNMRQHFNLENFNDDNDKVYKYGRTDDMARRAGEHLKTYGKLKDNSFSLSVFSYIDEMYACKAETKLKHFFNNMNVNVEDTKHHELIVMNKGKLQTMKELYNNIYNQFSGNNKDLIKQMQEMQLNHQHENELQRMKYEQSLKDKEHTIEVMTMKHKTELQEVELQYMRQLLANK